jgi:hypothetical protein
MGTDSGVLERIPPVVATDQGFFDQLGVKPDIQALTDGSKVLAGVVSNQLALGESGISNVLAAIEKSPTVKILGTTHLPVGYVVYANAGVKTLKDLEGKSVGTGAVGTFLHVLMFQLLKKNGVDPNKVTFVNIGASPDVYRAVAAGQGGCGAVDRHVHGASGEGWRHRAGAAVAGVAQFRVDRRVRIERQHCQEPRRDRSNVGDTGTQSKIVPFEQVTDTSLVQDALKLLN